MKKNKSNAMKLFVARISYSEEYRRQYFDEVRIAGSLFPVYNDVAVSYLVSI